MIELRPTSLTMSFPELPLRPQLELLVERTFRIPDDGRNYPLPSTLNLFPLRDVDDHAARVPAAWLDRGGVLLPIWQSDALRFGFYSQRLMNRRTEYPFAVKVATGKVSAITGEVSHQGLSGKPQNYIVTSGQRRLDGYCVQKGILEQFVAMPPGGRCSVEDQITTEAEFSVIQVEVFPLRAEIFERRFPATDIVSEIIDYILSDARCDMAPGGRIRQEIYADPFSIHDWDTEHLSRCFIHLVNATTWHALTGQQPPSKPLTAQQYKKAGFPWFDYYEEDVRH